MNRKITSFMVIILLAASYIIIMDTSMQLVDRAGGTTLYVNKTGSNGAYTHIQWAIDNASDGDTIFVYSGVYYENIVVNKTISLIGENRNTTIIDGNGVGNVVYLTNADYINITNLGIRNGEIGIRIAYPTSNYNNISWNRIYDIFSTEDAYGFYGGAFNNIYHNIVHNVSSNGTDKDATGIATSLSNNVFYNTIYKVISKSGSSSGIGVGASCNVSLNVVYNISSNGMGRYSSGIYLESSNNNITLNSIYYISSNNKDTFAIGIYLYSSSGNNVSNNRIFNISSLNYTSIGIFLDDSPNNVLYLNQIFNITGSWFGGIGIEISSSNDNKFVSNYIYNISSIGNGLGIRISGSLRGYFTSNWIYSITAFGNAVGVRWASSSSENWNITSNIIYDIFSLNYSTIGIITSAKYTNIVTNRIFNVTSQFGRAYGIRLIGGGRESNLTSNNIYNIYSTNNVANGICLEWPADHNNITQNLIYNITSGFKANGIHLNWSSNYNNLTSNNINNISSPTGVAYGMDFRDASLNIIENCTINNTQSGVHFDEQSIDNIFINCSISNTEIYDFHFDDDFGGDSHAVTLNTTFNKTRVYYEDTLSNLTVKWFMHVKVIYFNGTPVSNAEIWVNDTYGNSILEGQTDSEGWARWIVVTEYVEQDIDGDHIGDRFYFTPHYVTATDGNLWGYASPYMGISKIVVIVLGLPTYLLPPTNLTTKVVNSGKNVELEWDSIPSPALDHYLIYRADSGTKFDFTMPYNSSTTWPNPKNTTWIDPDSSVIAIDDDFYYIIRAANSDESDISSTSNTAGVWTRTFQAGISTFSLPLDPFLKKDVEFYCQEMNASYIKWMNLTTHTWMRHERGTPWNNTLIEIGKGYEIGFEVQTRYTFTGMPGAMILYDDVSFGFDATPFSGDADSLTAKVNNTSGTVTLNWSQPANMGSEEGYYVLRSTSRDGFWGTLGVNYTRLAVLPFNVLSYQDVGNATPGSEYYYIIVPVNLSTGERGVSSYSIGVWTASYLKGYDTVSLPLRPKTFETVDRYCDDINETVGINYFDYFMQRWSWHSKRMPERAFDPLIGIGLGYQISTNSVTKYSFVGM